MKYKKTSDRNLQKILATNNCATIEELNKQETVYINVVNLSGHINIADFTQNALTLVINCRNEELNGLAQQYSKDQNQIREDIKNKYTNRVDLDASFAGDFTRWAFGENYENIFIRSIKLRHENQVFDMESTRGFRIRQDSLYQMVVNAKSEATNRNMIKFSKDKKYSIFHEDLGKIQTSKMHINGYEAQIDTINEKIAKLVERRKEFETQIKVSNVCIIGNLEDIANKNQNAEHKIPLNEIMQVKFDTRTCINNESGDQAYSYQVLSNDAVEKMRIANRTWHEKLNQELTNKK